MKLLDGCLMILECRRHGVASSGDLKPRALEQRMRQRERAREREGKRESKKDFF